jgi:hypothetical protein
MYNITLICTRHSEIGKCNINELYKIIERIKPDLIFEEIPPSFFDKYYITKTLSNLETDTISKYLETHTIEHIPVDSDNVPPESFFQDHKYLLDRIEGLADRNGFDYRTLTDSNKMYVQIYGFAYLNNSKCMEINQEIRNVIEQGLQKINDNKLFQIFKSWNEIIEMRDNEMLKNIYSYSKEQSYDNAIFTIGYAHRKSISMKIEKYEKEYNIKLNWSFYNT